MTKLWKFLNKKFNPKGEALMTKNNTFVSAVIVCAGNSTRMGTGKSKQFITLLSKPAIYYTLKAFHSSVSIKEVVLVCRSCDREEFENIVETYNFTKVKAIVEGGSTRSKSVENGVKATNPQSTHVAIHDGARCLVTTEEIEKVVLSGILTGASTLGVPVKDTIKIISDNDKIKETPNRNFLRAVQTPQVFSKEQYLENIKTAAGFSEEFTDDCQLFERCGCTVTIVEGLYTNIKLTTQEDVKLAESILESRGNCENRTRV